MEQETSSLGALVENHMEVEAGIVQTLEAINEGLSAILQQGGLYGPDVQSLDALGPLLETLQNQSAESQKSRRVLYSKVRSLCGDSPADDPADTRVLIEALQTVQPEASEKLKQQKQRITQRLTDAAQQLTANQAVLFYSMEFHRRYLLGVLECESEQTNYQADGQVFKLPPEKILGRNC